MKKISLFLLLMIMNCFIFAVKISVLTDINRPDKIVVDKDQLFIAEGASIYIYSLDGKLQKKFGKKGEGPKEFLVTADAGGLQIDILPEMIMATSIGKVSFFKRDGEYIREIKAPRGVALYKPLGEKGKRFTGLGFARDTGVVYATINLYDNELKLVKEIYRQKNPYQQGQKMNPFLTPPMVYTCKNTIVVDTRTGGILVFNDKGERRTIIEHKFEKIKLTDEHKKQVLHFYRTDPDIKDNFQYIKNLIQFPDVFPHIQQCAAEDGKIYAQTYRRKGNEAEFFVFDFNGKLLKHLYLPLSDMNLMLPYPYNISNNFLYQVAEDLEKEEWGLYSAEIK